MDRQLNVGYIPYLNCIPFFHFLAAFDFQGELFPGVPSELNRMLQRGEIDVSPSSSFEYARHWRDYLLLPGHSISSTGPVESVLLFSPVPLADLEGESISITGDSATSINLLRVILREFVGLRDFSDHVPGQPVEELINKGKPALLIGDRALQTACLRPAGMHRYDLGQLWEEQTGLPFVFALWIVRRDAVTRFGDQLRTLGEQLTRSRERFFAEIEKLAGILCPESCLTEQGKIAYWRRIDYGLGESELRGLQLFHELCRKHGLLAEQPQIEFLE